MDPIASLQGHVEIYQSIRSFAHIGAAENPLFELLRTILVPTVAHVVFLQPRAVSVVLLAY